MRASTRMTITTLGVLTAAGLTAGVVAAPDAQVPAPAAAAVTPAVPAAVDAARLTALERQADDAGLAAQRADEALLEHRDAGTVSAARHARAALVEVAEQQEPQLAAIAGRIGVDAVTAAETGLADTSAVAVTVALRGRTKALKAVSFARKQLGKPYHYAGAGPRSFDCSGLTMKAYKAVRVGIGGHGATAQWRTAKAEHRLVSYRHARAGDLIFYGRPGAVYHVAMYSGHGRMIEAPYPGKRVREVAVRSAGRLSTVARPA